MADDFFHSYIIDDRSHLALVKREIHNLIATTGFNNMRAGEVDIIISELTSNLIKHANGGELLYRLSDFDADSRQFEVYCLDNGPGTNEINKYMKDGLSSTNTLGHGLGSISRLSNFFQIYSMRNWGTIAYARALENVETILPRKVFEYELLQVCAPGEQVCGDGCSVKITSENIFVFVGDGLGHGINAHEAVQEAIVAFKNCMETDPVEIIRYIHQKVKRTRGLVATVAVLNKISKTWKLCGVGNITTRFYDGLVSKNYIPNNGIIGLNIPNSMHSFNLEQEAYQWLIMCSDGLKSRWELAKYTSILKYSPAVLAATLFKDNARRNDDMTVFVGKINN